MGQNISATSVSTQVIFGIDLLTFCPDIAYERPNCEKNKIVPVMFWPTVYKSQERYAGINKWHSRTGEKPAFISGIHCVPRFSVVSEI